MPGACLCCICFLLAIGIASYLVVYYFGDEGDIQDLKDAFDLFGKEDPFAGLNETSSWRNDGRGLRLTILNALDDDWYTYFNTAVEQWDSGSPDSLTLSTETRQPDSECPPEDGYLKVCNGDYGETYWKGINKAFMDSSGKHIYASTSLMNEFYLPSSSVAERQYTMCHEIGHGFGLPHTDENFYNRDQGNCMDYTIFPKNNQQPDDENFLLLAEVYGVVSNTTSAQQSKTTSSTSSSKYETKKAPESSMTSEDILSNDNSTTATEAMASVFDYVEEKENGGNRRHLRSREQVDSLASNTNTVIQSSNSPTEKNDISIESKNTIPNWIVEASNHINTLFTSQSNDHLEASSLIQDPVSNRYYQRRLVHRSQFGEVHKFDIGQGHTIEVHLLLANQPKP